MKTHFNFSYLVRHTSYLLLSVLLFSCTKYDSPNVSDSKPPFVLSFVHLHDGHELVIDSLLYTNAMQQHYLVSDLQYFISGIAFHQCNGEWEKVTDNDGIHYVDDKIPSTLGLELNLKNDCYDSIRFTFGLNEADNISNRFPDPPERDMFWPEVLGGGYHYMKMNLKWKNDTMTELMPFMFHLGTGQVYKGNNTNPDSIIGFVPNHFQVQMACLADRKYNNIILAMDISRWFSGQNDFDFSSFPMGIMQNQEGMYNAVQNGSNVFSIIYYLQTGK